MSEEFLDYAAARWPLLVRVAVLLGAPASLAPDVVTEALSRLRGEWRRLDTSGDPDTEALDLVVAVWDDLRTRDWWVDHPAEPTPAGLGALDGLVRDDRSALVLQHVGGFDAHDAGGPLDPALWAAARALPVTAPAPGRAELGIAARRRRHRRTRRGAGVVGGLAAVVVVVALAVVGGRALAPAPDDPALPRALAPVASTTGPQAWITWYADGQVHLGAAALAVPGVQALVEVPGGAVLVDADDRVVRVDPQGRRLLLGRTDDASTLVSSVGGSVVGWVDTTEPTTRTLTVVDGADGQHRRTRSTSPTDEVRTVGLRDDRLYVARGDTAWAWGFDSGATQRLAEPGLQRVTGQLAVFRPATRDGALRVAYLDPSDRLPPPATWIEVPGDEVVLAPSGRLVLTRTTGGQARLLDLGVPGPQPSQPTGVADDQVALAAALGVDDRLAYLVARAADRPGAGDFVRSTFAGTVTLRTCTTSQPRQATECLDIAQFSGTAEMPLLAR